MQTLWKLSQDGNSASRTLGNGSFESRLVIAIPVGELATALPADPVQPLPLSVQARVMLDSSDITMLRCVEAGVTVPAAWNTYRKALRAIATEGDKVSTALPTQPPFVAGT